MVIKNLVCVIFKFPAQLLYVLFTKSSCYLLQYNLYTIKYSKMRRNRFALSLALVLVFIWLIASSVKSFTTIRSTKKLSFDQEANDDADNNGIVSSALAGNNLFSSSLHCTGTDRRTRVCRFSNICYDADRKSWIFFKTDDTLMTGNVPPPMDDERQTLRLLDTTSVADHNVFYWDYVETVPNAYDQSHRNAATWIPKTTFVFNRFLASNIMHTFHDDIIPLFNTIREFQAKGKSSSSDKILGSSEIDHNLLFLESAGKDVNEELYRLLSKNPFMELDDLKGLVCFRDAIIGLSKRSTWYQYGFSGVQGPIPNKKVNGAEIRLIASQILSEMNHDDHDNDDDDDKTEIIVIFSRRRNRLIVNEKELAKRLESEFQLPVKFVRMEDRSLTENIKLVARARIAVGMHGSMLIMAMFLPVASILIELYPYAVPADNYTPFRTLAHLPGMDIVYYAWINMNGNNNIMHPDRPAGEGGIRHLSQDLQDKILNTLTVPPHPCCTDPYWLFRIYQDTIVDIEELVTLIRDKAMVKSDSIRESFKKGSSVDVSPAAIDIPFCKMDKATTTSKNELIISWSPPWNLVSVADVNYEVWIHETFKGYQVRRNLFRFPCELGQTYTVYVRALFHGDQGKGPYSPAQKCICN